MENLLLAIMVFCVVVVLLAAAGKQIWSSRQAYLVPLPPFAAASACRAQRATHSLLWNQRGARFHMGWQEGVFTDDQSIANFA